VYARHIAEGGVPNDERWNHIKGLCEEYKKMAGFVRATRGGQFNESAQKLVESGIAHYQSLRESLSKMTGKRGYNTYFESWTPPLMEDDSDTSNLNELFVEESLDPRIESVMPILSKLQKKVSEMKEVDALAEWADSIDRPQGDANKTAEKVLSQFPMQLGEEESLTSNNPVGIPETSGSGLDAILARYPEAVEDFKQGGELDYDLESDLWDYYFNNGDIRNYDADASEYIGQQLADYLGVNEGIIDTIKKGVKKGLEKVGGGSDIDQLKRLQKNMGIPKSAQHGKPAMAKSKEQGVAEGSDELYQKAIRKYTQRVANDYLGGGNDYLYGANKFDSEMFGVDPKQAEQDFDRLFAQLTKPKGVAEDLDANQKRVGQLGPTEKVKNNNIGKLVGANENFINTVDQAVVTEMDSEGYRGSRDDANEIGKGKESYGKAMKAKDASKKFGKELDKQFDKAHDDKKEVKEGQEDFDAMMRILKK
jgi:tetratricopeptide (TPR) repeat protein